MGNLNMLGVVKASYAQDIVLMAVDTDESNDLDLIYPISEYL